MKAILALENGMTFEGVSVGAAGETSGEVVFITSLTGLPGGPDRSVCTPGRSSTMTAPQIGNYGVTAEDSESRAVSVAGFVMREASPTASNWRGLEWKRGSQH